MRSGKAEMLTSNRGLLCLAAGSPEPSYKLEKRSPLFYADLKIVHWGLGQK